jgi:tetratricopeptide (TPR) repeat protein
MKSLRNCLVLIIGLLFLSQLGFAQAKYEEARAYFDSKNYQSAAPIYKELYAQKPDNQEVYQEFLLTLMALKDYKKAEDLVRSQLKKQSNNPLILIDLGNVFIADKKEKKATEQFEYALKYINGDDILTQQVANSFSNSGLDQWAIRTYERAAQIVQVPNLYNAALAKLYNKAGDVEKAISLVIDGAQNQMQMVGDESIEITLLEIMGNDTEKQKKAQKAIIKLVGTQPDNFLYSYLLTWIFSVQNNWDQALVQITALDKRSKDKGRLLTDFAQKASLKKQFDVARKAYETVINYNESSNWNQSAKEGLLLLELSRIKEDPFISKSEIEKVERNFDEYFAQYPEAFSNPILNDYALLVAQYAQHLDKGILLLKKAIDQNRGTKVFIGNCKLQIGDYYIIQEKIWEAALMYAQVDKAFREDAMGEEARFRNAKLSYYQSDFEQAQGQLSVLKASTSELIANDALFLSVLITENVPPDSNMVPLQRFAFADLLLFQNKDLLAAALLDSITKAFPKNPLVDDILLLHSKIAMKRKDFTKAISFLKQIVTEHGKDVLADDAVFQIAEIYQNFIHNKEEARKYYEQLIIDYPGSSFVQKSRLQLKEMPLL